MSKSSVITYKTENKKTNKPATKAENKTKKTNENTEETNKTTEEKTEESKQTTDKTTDKITEETKKSTENLTETNTEETKKSTENLTETNTEETKQTTEQTTEEFTDEPEDCTPGEFEDLDDTPCPFDDDFDPYESEEYEEEYEYESEDEYTVVNLRSHIKVWLKKTSFKAFRDAICTEVKGQEGVEDILFCVYNYMQCLASNRRHNNHVMVAAPSGCGKSATYQALHRYFAKEIPEFAVSRCDLSNITETGYKGMDPSFALSALFENLPFQDGEGIVFLDEFDKKMIPSFGSNGADNNLAVQNQILTIIEGSRVPNSDKSNTKYVNTENTLFIAMGSFDCIRKQRKEKSVQESKTIGFRDTSTEGYNHFREITREDILKIGTTNELMGRFPVLVNFHPLEKKVVDEIIDVQVERVGENFGTKLEVDKSFREELHKDANGPFGCREFYNKIFSTAMAGQKKMLLEGLDCGNDSYRIVLSAGKKFRLVRNTCGAGKDATRKNRNTNAAAEKQRIREIRKEKEKIS